MDEFGQRLLRLCNDRDLSLRELARRAHVDPGHLSRVVSGARPPTAALAIAVDRALAGGGTLVALAPPTDRRTVEAGVRESGRLASLLDEPPAAVADDIRERADRLAVAYLTQPAAMMHHEAAALRSVAGHALRGARAGDAADLAVAVGRLSGVLGYAALDMGDPVAAMVHVDLTYRCGRRAGDAGLMAWARGTQSLISRFAGDYPAALTYAVDGLDHAPHGTGRARLLSGVAQCHANMGDGSGADEALAEADRVREAADGDDVGLFGFPRAKQRYYLGSTLIWLPGRAHAALALTSADEAIGMWAAGAPDERSHDDEALAHVYAATAAAQLHDLDVVVAHLAPILDLPADRRISWIRKRMARVAELLSGPLFVGQPVAVETVERIREYR